MKAYARRLAKFLLLIVVIFFVFMFLIPWLSRGVTFDQTFGVLTASPRMKMVLLFLLLYVLIYPVLNYVRKERYITGRFEDNRPAIEEAMQELGFVKEVDDGSRLVFRRKSKYSRTVMLGEDAVEIDVKSKPLVLKGPRRDIKRVDMALDAKLLGKG